MASFNHHFCFPWLKPLIFTWYHLNVVERNRKPGNGHMGCWKIPRCLYKSREQTKVIQSGAGWKHPAVHEAHHQHVLQASLPLHGEAKPANIGAHSPKGNGNWPWGSARTGILGGWAGEEICYVTATRQPPQRSQVMVLSGDEFYQAVLLSQIQIYMSRAG